MCGFKWSQMASSCWSRKAGGQAVSIYSIGSAGTDAFLMAGLVYTPVTPKYKTMGLIRRSRLLFFWRWEVRRHQLTEPVWCGFGFTRADAERQAHQWASALL